MIAGTGLGAGALYAMSMKEPAPLVIKKSGFVVSQKDSKFKSSHDVIVVGSGAAGCSSALSARLSGKENVIVLEKEGKLGGTTGKSGGIFWVPNNPLMKEDGMNDSKEDFLKYACKASFPDDLDEKKNCFGIKPLNYAWLEKFYDEGGQMVEALRGADVCTHLSRFTKIDGKLMTDYFYTPEQEPLNKSPNGRAMGIGSDKKTRDQFQWLSKQIDAAEGTIRSVHVYAHLHLHFHFPFHVLRS